MDLVLALGTDLVARRDAVRLGADRRSGELTRLTGSLVRELNRAIAVTEGTEAGLRLVD